MMNVPLIGLLLAVCSIAPAAIADAVTTREGIAHTGTIVKITGEHITLTKAHQAALLMRSAVVEVTFDVSDVVVLARGDTLHGKVLRTDDSILVVASGEGIRAVPVASVAGIAYAAGGVLRVREIADTDGSFHAEEVAPKIVRTALSFSLSVGAQNTVFTYGGSPAHWLSGYQEPPIEKHFAGALYDLEAGLDIDSGFSASLGILLYSGEANSPGTPELREAGYFCFYASGMYHLFPHSRLDVYLRLRLGVGRGWWKLYENVNRDATNPAASIVPGVGIQYRLFSLLQVYCECDRHFVTLPLSEKGESLDTKGFVCSLGLRMYVPGVGQ